VLDDLRFAIRRLRHSPGFTIGAALTLALAIGANAATFSVADAVLFRPLPYADPDRVYALEMADRQSGRRFRNVSDSVVQAITAHHSGLGPVGTVGPPRSLTMQGPDGSDAVSVQQVSANYFEILGVRPVHGRVFSPADGARPDRPALLTWAGWQRLAAGRDIVGTTLGLGTTSFDVVGVLPREFVSPVVFGGKPDLFTIDAPPKPGERADTFDPVVRLERGVTREQAQAELDALVLPLLSAEDHHTTVVLSDVRALLYPTGAPIMRFLLAASGLVLLLGCANLANMLLARARRRERETGVRVALGASRVRIVRPVVIESLLIGVAGAAVALAGAYLSFDWLIREVPRVVYRNAEVGMDARIVAFTLALGFVAGLLFSVIPAWRAFRVDAVALMQGRAYAGRILGGVLGRPMIAVQVALAIVIVFGAVIAARALLAVLTVPLGFSPERVITISVRAPNDTSRRQFYARVVERLRARADVEAAGAIGSMPFDGRAPDEGVFDTEGRKLPAGLSNTLPGYFESVGIPLVRGRLLQCDDLRNGTEVAVLSQSAATTLFAGRDPIGGSIITSSGRRLTLVGIVGDVQKSLDRDSAPPVYGLSRETFGAATVVARMRPGVMGDAVLRDIRRDVSALAPGGPVTASWWIEQIRNVTAYRNPRFQTLVLGGFAILGLTLTAVGVFAMVALLVSLRIREMGIRLAIGASPGSLVRLIIRQTIVPAGIGVMGGLIATRWLARLAEAQLFKVDTRDPWTIALAATTVIAAAFVAAYIPARRGVRVDPVVVLRAD
jgi:putative ABC transport system permease protein